VTPPEKRDRVERGRSDKLYALLSVGISRMTKDHHSKCTRPYPDFPGRDVALAYERVQYNWPLIWIMRTIVADDVDIDFSAESASMKESAKVSRFVSHVSSVNFRKSQPHVRKLYFQATGGVTVLERMNPTGGSRHLSMGSRRQLYYGSSRKSERLVEGRFMPRKN
jgi:hypothetical protein